jgi:hypothetical protein
MSVGTPLPESVITVGELVALLTTLRLPDAIPDVLGAKLTVSGRLWPTARVSAPVNPLRLNPVLVVACEMLMLEMLTAEGEPPTSIVPSWRLRGLGDNKYYGEGEVGAASVPVPEMEIVAEFLRLVCKTMVPLKVRAASGRNTTWIDTLP